MPFDKRTKAALEAIRPRIERFHSALAVTAEEVRGLLSGAGETAEDQSIALGKFASAQRLTLYFLAYALESIPKVKDHRF